MFSKWRERKRRNREIVDRLYVAVTDRARQSFLYEEAGVPDTVFGRFEALSLHMFLFLRRCRGEPQLQAIAQDVVDRFIVDVEHSIRELGVGDQSVPKRMRKLAGHFYERVSAYDKAFEAEDPGTALAQAFQTRLLTDAAEGGDAQKLADYALGEADRLSKLGPDTILAGQFLETEAQ